MPAGRPKELTPELLETAHTYSEFPDGADIKTWEPGYKKHGQVIPTIEGFAIYVGIHRDTVYAWEKENDEFSDIVEGIRSLQAQMLINKGLSGAFNASISKLLLSGKHGYIEKTETDVTSKGEQITQPISHELVQEFNDFIKEKTKAK